jgi:hypothetical protein
MKSMRHELKQSYFRLTKEPYSSRTLAGRPEAVDEYFRGRRILIDGVSCTGPIIIKPPPG